MTENEVIKTLKIMLENNSIGMENKQEVLEVTIQALEEIQQYRAIGTVKQFEWCKDASHWKELFKDKLEQYESIGTVEEFKSLKECFGHTTPKSRGKAIYDKAIDKFTEKLKSDEFQKYNLDMVFETSRDLSYTNCISAFCEYIDEMAKQMKGE